jgi:hypothetical protein
MAILNHFLQPGGMFIWNSVMPGIDVSGAIMTPESSRKTRRAKCAQLGYNGFSFMIFAFY